MTTSANRSVGFGVNPDACSGLTFGISAGAVFGTSGRIDKGPQKIVLPASSTNYVQLDAGGVVSANTSAFTSGYDFLYIVTTGASQIAGVQDWRFNPGVSHPLGAVASLTATVAGIGQAPSSTSIFSLLASGLAADASVAVTGDVYINTSNILMVKPAS